MKLCIIPARGGSKRIPRKNIRHFCGKPIIAWSIEAAQASACFDRIMVSTDDEEIAAVASCYGAQIPFLRPAELADDFAGTIPVVAHAVDWYLNHGYCLSSVCCLYATAPLVDPDDLRRSYDLLSDVKPDRFVFASTAYAAPVQRALRVDPESGIARMWQPDQFDKRSQDLEVAYHDAGQFYWGRPDAWLKSHCIFEGSKPLILPRWRVQDIDTEDDWIRAELICMSRSRML